METNSRSSFHPDYALLAGRVFVDRIHRATKKRFTDWVTCYGTGESIDSASFLFFLPHSITGPHAILRPDFVDAVLAHADALDEAIIHARDYGFYL